MHPRTTRPRCYRGPKVDCIEEIHILKNHGLLSISAETGREVKLYNGN